ncbi:MAG: heat-inducible transcription repressor HrcA [Candidatus Aminicenantes bacterium RBG_16_63_14]|nr:MAG: heat-inducible transcription repressor HrcA [Candidatus Aminicenantes bacterium RBG_16_63_14]OGD27605.1 MAG: heat-inducible transcription repressor HrcA [Candidatus Aminicenantes bacterium RBG_19FT_COMBO_65_30]
MVTSVLRDKDKKVLILVVESFVRHGRPVSSGSICQTRRITASPATLRNIMAKLEEMGFLSQPHTSAGRVPTDKGLRYYVGGLIAEKALPEERVPLIQGEFPNRTADFDSLLTQACRILADSSDNMGFVISPHIFRLPFEHLRFVKISDRRILVILVTPFHMVLTETLESSLPLTQAELDRASQYVNQNFRGKTIFAVRDALLRELPKHRIKYEDTLNKLLDLFKASIDKEEGESRIFLQGTSRLLGKADLFDMDKLRALFQNFEEKAALVRLLSDFISLDRVKVLIGAEVNFPKVEDCSLVLSHYGYSNQVLGTLGIIGPKRIPYEKIIPLVDRMAKSLSLAITVFGREVSL